jgi:CRP-like cAMP-binding protein
VAVEQTADQGAVVPPSPRDIPLFVGFADEAVLFELAGAFTRRDVTAGSVIAERGQLVDQLYVVAHGKVTRTGSWAFGEDHVLGPVADGRYLGDEGLAAESAWEYTAAATDRTLLALPRERFQAVVAGSDALQDQVR